MTDLYVKLTSYKQKVKFDRDINLKHLVLREYIFTEVPLNAGAPYTAVFNLSLGSRYSADSVRTDGKKALALPLTDSYTFVQHPNGHALQGMGDGKLSELDFELLDSDGTAAQFTEAHLWFKVK